MHDSNAAQGTDGLLKELAAIADELSALPEDSFEDRARLQKRRRELHNAATQLANDPSDPVVRASLTEELERLEEQWLALQRDRIDVVKQAGDLAAGNFGLTSDAMRLNRAIDEARGRAELEERIRRLRTMLTDEEAD
jgi:hypothetical protein